MYKKLHIHFVGIGGVGMSGIAEVLLNLGYPVSGSDLKRSAVTARLSRLGAVVRAGHRPEHVNGAEVVVYSSAVAKGNPELAEAVRRGIPVVRRAEMLAELMRLTKYGIAVAGTHGKTTTTSLLSSILHTAGLDPTIVIGGRLNSLKTNAKLGRGDFLVAEADESDGSFLHLTPTVAIVTNMDPDHMENYGGDFARYREAFGRFCAKVPFYGLVVLCGEHPETRALAKRLDRRVCVYGFDRRHDYNARNITFVHARSYFDLYRGTHFAGRIELPLAGNHNVLNALASIAVAEDLGVDLKRIAKALKEFQGVGRRMEVLYKGSGMVVLDDYGHHPEEIKATLAAVRRAYSGRIVVAFQPHRYSRTKALYKEFLACFAPADELYVTGIYPAGEAPIRGVSARGLSRDLRRRRGGVSYVAGSMGVLASRLLATARAGDVILTLGAGDITKAGHALARELKKREGEVPESVEPKARLN